MTLIYERVLGDDVPHEIMGYHDDDNGYVRDMSKYIVRTDKDDENAQTIGLELEVSHRDKPITEEMIEEMFDIFPFQQLSYDSTVPGIYTFEAQTVPMTRNGWKESGFDKYLQWLRDNGFCAYALTNTDSGDGCGGHIHISKGDQWEDIVSLMAMFIDQNKEIVQIICKRPFTGYARNNLKDLGKSTRRYYLPEVKSFVLSNSDMHSNTLNLQHSATIEFRLPVGTLNYETKMAHIEFITNLYKCCEDIVKGRARIDRLTINKVCQDGDFLPNYIKELCISCSKKLIILDSEIKKQAKEIETKKNKLIKILSNLQYELGVAHDDAIRQGSINTITRHFNNIAGTGNLQQIIYSIQDMKRNGNISNGLESYSVDHNNNITKYYAQLKEYINNIEVEDIFHDIMDEM